jgi:spore germination protein
MIILTVQRGDALWSLSQRYRVPINQISAANMNKVLSMLIDAGSYFCLKSENSWILRSFVGDWTR